MSKPEPDNPYIHALLSRDRRVVEILDGRDSSAAVATHLSAAYPPEIVATEEGAKVWEWTGQWFMTVGRHHEALELFWRLYQQMLAGQRNGRCHKGMPLCWISDCYRALNYRLHAKRFLMLTLCEDALREGGTVSPDNTGSYFRLVWQYGLSDADFRLYAQRFNALALEFPNEAGYPEALLQRADDRWMIEFPSEVELGTYVINAAYVDFLLSRIGDPSGIPLEQLAEYLMSAVPGCRARRRQRSHSTDYDVTCSIEGIHLDFRSELGRYFLCECKDWSTPASFEVLAKFSRILTSIKARFGVLFSRNGITGEGRTLAAARERLKLFHDSGIVIVVLDRADLDTIVTGANLIQLLRERYEAVRLDLQ